MTKLIDKRQYCYFLAFDQLSPAGHHTLFFDFFYRPFFEP